MLFGARQDRLGKGMVADSSSGKLRVVVWEYREVCRVPVTAEFMASAQ